MADGRRIEGVMTFVDDPGPGTFRTGTYRGECICQYEISFPDVVIPWADYLQDRFCAGRTILPVLETTTAFADFINIPELYLIQTASLLVAWSTVNLVCIRPRGQSDFFTTEALRHRGFLPGTSVPRWYKNPIIYRHGD